jgi:dipeptidyl aminopeptidase/acylaminoacyl peptidase
MIKKIRMLFVITGFLFLTNSIFTNEPNDILSLAFDSREFVYFEKPTINSDGHTIAYSVRQRPADVNLSTRYLSNGTPTLVAGSRIYLLHVNGLETMDVDSTVPGDCWRPSWSPDGTQLAFYSNANGIVQVWIHDLPQNVSKKLSDLPITSSVFAVDTAVWSPDGKTLYVPLDPSEKHKKKSPESNKTIGKFYTSNDTLKLSQRLLEEESSNLTAIDVQTGTVRVLVAHNADPAPGFLKISPTGKWLSYLANPLPLENPRYTSVDLAITSAVSRDKITTIEKDLVNKNLGFERYVWHPMEDMLVYVKEGCLYSAEIEGDNSPIVKQIYANPNIELIEEPLLFTQDGTAVAVTANSRQDSGRATPQAIFIIPLKKDGQVKEIILEDRWRYIETVQANPGQIWQPEEGTVTMLLDEVRTGEAAIVRFALEGASHYDVLWKGVAKLSNFVSGKDSKDIFFEYENFGTPPNIYRASSDFSRFDRISTLDERYEDLKFSTAEVFETTVPLYNGELKKVRTAVLLPKGAKKGDRLPGIVAFYPGADTSRLAQSFCGGNLVSIPNFVFLQRGYALILPEICLGPEGVAGDPVREIADILLPQVYQAACLGCVDIEKLGIMGQSYGGYGTAATIATTSLFRGAVAISGSYDLPSSYGYFDDDYPLFNINWSEHGQGRMGTHPWADPFRYIRNSPYYLADKIQTPLMLIHGENDEACNVQEARKLFSALKRLHRKAYLNIYPGQGHVVDSWGQLQALDATRRILDFFDDNVKNT